MLTQQLQQTILGAIISDKQQWLAARKTALPLTDFIDKLTPSDRNFYTALSGKPSKFILECKKASPSKGLIRVDFNLDHIASVYQHYADAISVLTDEKYFQGDFSYISQVRSQVSQPVLCKDFIIDPYQVYLARYSQADAILLMLSVVDDDEYQTLAALAHSLNMGVLTEVSNEDELARAIALGARVIGINNRDLRDLSIDLNRTKVIAAQIPPGRIIISESGIYTNQQVRELALYANGFLVGSSLMSEDNIDMACRRLILGENKVCGLTQADDAVVVYQQGGCHGGLIFTPKSPRCITPAQAEQVMAAAPLAYVGVFLDQPVKEVAAIANQLKLHAVQLHGQEDDAYLTALRGALSDDIAIWKAHGINLQASTLNIPKSPLIDRLLLDCRVGGQSGGTGQAFDWTLLQDQDCSQMILAGGLHPANAQQAAALRCCGLDLNSGVESAPGIKDHSKIVAAFAALRDY